MMRERERERQREPERERERERERARERERERERESLPVIASLCSFWSVVRVLSCRLFYLVAVYLTLEERNVRLIVSELLFTMFLYDERERERERERQREPERERERERERDRESQRERERERERESLPVIASLCSFWSVVRVQSCRLFYLVAVYLTLEERNARLIVSESSLSLETCNS